MHKVHWAYNYTTPQRHYCPETDRFYTVDAQGKRTLVPSRTELAQQARKEKAKKE